MGRKGTLGGTAGPLNAPEVGMGRHLTWLACIFASCAGAPPDVGLTCGDGCDSGAPRLGQQLINDVRDALGDPDHCRAAFAPHASLLAGQETVTLPSLTIGSDLTLSPGASLPRYDFSTGSVTLQSVTAMVPLDGVGTAVRATLVLNGRALSDQSATTLNLGEIAFYFDDAAHGSTLLRCEARPYALLRDLFSLRASLEGDARGDPPASQVELYQRALKQATSLLGEPTLDDAIPTRGNMGWPVMDRVYPLGLLQLLDDTRGRVGGPLATDKDYSERAASELMAVALGAHANDGHGFDYTNWFQSPTDPMDSTQTLQGAQIALAVAVGLDWFRDHLSTAQKDTLIDALDQKALAVFTDSFRHYAGTCDSACTPADRGATSWWIASQSNWNLVNNGSLLVVLKVLSYEVDPAARPTLASRLQMLSRSITIAAKPGDASSLSYGTTALTDDGGWFEGPDYWGYALENLAAAATSYAPAELGLAPNLHLDRTLAYALAMRNADGRVFDYSDAVDAVTFYPATFWLASATGAHAATRYEDRVRKAAGNQPYAYTEALALAWMNGADLDPAGDDPPAVLASFPTTQVATVLDLTSGANMYVGWKGGSDAALTTHRQQDSGEFIFEADRVRWAVDLGRDDYGLPHYSDRYIYYRQRPEGNNSLSVAGEYLVTPVASPLTITSATPEEVVAKVDLTAAYQAARAYREGKPTGAGALATRLASATRKFTLGLKPGQGYLAIEDDLALSAGDRPPAVTWNMNLPAVDELSSSAGALTLASMGQTLRVFAIAVHGAISGLSVDDVPAPSAIGPFLNPTTGSPYTEGGQRPPPGAKALHVVVQPDGDGSTTQIKVYLIPGSSSFQP
jgi:hypothetical protein